MEIRDLYDEFKNLTGLTIKKGELVPTGKYYITVVGFIVNSYGELLIQVNKKYNKWSITGGHPKSGQDSLAGIKCEIKEELGIDINTDIILFKTIKTEDDFVDLYYIKTDIDINALSVQEEEVGAVKWLSLDEINQLINNNKFLESHILFINYFKEYINQNKDTLFNN